jgi:hypothetical protein
VIAVFLALIEGSTWSGKSRSGDAPTDGENNHGFDQGFHFGAFSILRFFLSPCGKFQGQLTRL